MAGYAHGEGMRIFDQGLHRPDERGPEVDRERDRHDQCAAEQQHTPPPAVRHRHEHLHEER